MVGPAGLPGEPDLFFENLGDGTFREASGAHGLTDAARAYGFGVVASDVNDDGAVDLFVANDSNPNFLYLNDGQGHFASAGLMAGVAVNGEARAQAGMGVDAGDADGDGRMDLVLTAFAHDRNTLYRNLGDATFEDASLQAGLATSTFQRMGWGVAFLDADLDGRQDLFVANGHIFADVGDHPELGERFAQKNQMLLNMGGTTFRDVSGAAGPGLQVEKVSRGLAVGDLDNDGDPDVVVSNMDDTPTLLENRQATGHHWVTLRLTAPTGNRLAIGAHVTVVAGGTRQVREVRSGGSFMSQGDVRVQVGLGTHAGPVDVEVRMPGGGALGMARAARRSPAYARADAGRTRVARRSPPLMRYPPRRPSNRSSSWAGMCRRACAVAGACAGVQSCTDDDRGAGAVPRASGSRQRHVPGRARRAGDRGPARRTRYLARRQRHDTRAPSRPVRVGLSRHAAVGRDRHPRARASRSRSAGARRRAWPRSMHAPSPTTSGAS